MGRIMIDSLIVMSELSVMPSCFRLSCSYVLPCSIHCTLASCVPLHTIAKKLKRFVSTNAYRMSGLFTIQVRPLSSFAENRYRSGSLHYAHILLRRRVPPCHLALHVITARVMLNLIYSRRATRATSTYTKDYEVCPLVSSTLHFSRLAFDVLVSLESVFCAP